jgi:hypothetical protein
MTAEDSLIVGRTDRERLALAIETLANLAGWAAQREADRLRPAPPPPTELQKKARCDRHVDDARRELKRSA